MKYKKVSIVIPVYNEEKYIGACLSSILNEGLGAFEEIIVVNNLSTDGTANIVKKFDGVLLISETQKGPNKARQRGLEKASGDKLPCQKKPLTPSISAPSLRN